MTLGLGIDAGGTSTRWALARPGGEVVASGEAGAMSANLLASGDGRARIRDTLAEIAQDVLRVGRPARIQAGFTGLAQADPALGALVAEPFGLEAAAVTVENDIVFAYRALFEPGEGYVVYAGTGSVAAFIDAEGRLHRAGGRGALLDDGGGGFWIAREALRHIWRLEDCQPGAWRESPMAREIFERLGGPEWARTKEAVYGGDRGGIGRLALAVASTAAADPAAMRILRQAGGELARLANAMVQRYGSRPIAATGRALALHPAIGAAMCAALPLGARIEIRASEAHHAAARLAAGP